MRRRQHPHGHPFGASVASDMLSACPDWRGFIEGPLYFPTYILPLFGDSEKQYYHIFEFIIPQFVTATANGASPLYHPLYYDVGLFAEFRI